jgi:hypothetical protein
MKTIKEKLAMGKPRTLEKNMRMPPAAMQRARDRAQEQTEQQNQSSSNYAIDRAEEMTTDAVRMVGDGAKDILRPKDRSFDTERYTQESVGKQTQQQSASRQCASRRRTSQYSERASAERSATEASQRATRQSAAKHAQQTANKTQRAAIKTADRAVKASKQATKAAAKAAEKTANAIKTAEKASVKTAQAAGKATAKGTQAAAQRAQAAARAAAQAARVAAKLMVTVAKAVAKAAAAMAKAAAAAAKALVAWIAAGGWVVVLIIIAVGAVAAILCTAFGVFFSDEADPGKLKAAIVDINTDFSNDLQARIDSLSTSGYDAVNVIYEGDFDGDSFMVNNWTDVLGVYAVKTTTDEAAGDEVLTVTPEKQQVLASTFLDMNTVNIRTEVETNTTTIIVDGEEVEETTTTLNIFIDIQSMTYLEGAGLYVFDEGQMEMLEELMSPQYYSFFAELIDVDIYGGLTAADFATLVNDLPTGTKGGAIAQAAISKVGTPYSVMDCSDLSQYAYAQAGVSIPGTSVTQAQYCYNNGYTIAASSLQPGDLIFWSKTVCSCGRWNEVHHVGVCIGNGRIVDASSSKGRVVLRDLWSSTNWQIVM